MTRSSVRPDLIVGLVIAVFCTVAVLLFWPADAESKAPRYRVSCLESVALVYEDGEYLDGFVVGTKSCASMAEAAKK